MSKNHNENDRPFFPVAGLQQLTVTHVSKSLNVWILLWKTWMVTESCYYKIFLCYFFCKDTYNLSKFVLNILNFLKLYHCCILHDYLPFIFLSFTFQLELLSSKLANTTFFQQSYANTRLCQYFLVNISWAE